MTKHTNEKLVVSSGAIYAVRGVSIARMDRGSQCTTPTERDANARRIVQIWNAWPDVLKLMRALGADNMYYAMSDEVHQAYTELENLLGEEVG